MSNDQILFITIAIDWFLSRLGFTYGRTEARPMKVSRPVESTAMIAPPAGDTSPPVILSSVHKATKNELEAILRKPALTREEK